MRTTGEGALHARLYCAHRRPLCRLAARPPVRVVVSLSESSDPNAQEQSRLCRCKFDSCCLAQRFHCADPLEPGGLRGAREAESGLRSRSSVGLSGPVKNHNVSC